MLCCLSARSRFRPSFENSLHPPHSCSTLLCLPDVKSAAWFSHCPRYLKLSPSHMAARAVRALLQICRQGNRNRIIFKTHIFKIICFYIPFYHCCYPLFGIFSICLRINLARSIGTAGIIVFVSKSK